MTIRVGVGGWKFAPWRGTFYPPTLAQKNELQYAASRLTAIEINATFYGRQKPQSYRDWAAAAPDGFRFSLKASRYTTARKVLADGAQSIANLLGAGFTELGDKLGPFLWQFPAEKGFDPGDFARFLDLIPDQQDGVALRHALEPRHENFRDTRFFDLAKQRNMAVVMADSDEYPCFDGQTADFTYTRLQRSTDATARGYDDAALDGWAQKAREWSTGGRDMFAFFIGGAKVRNPAAAQALIKRVAG